MLRETAVFRNKKRNITTINRRGFYGKPKENHKYLETNGDYRMRELDKSDLEQFNALLQYAFQVTSYELLQTGWEQDE